MRIGQSFSSQKLRSQTSTIRTQTLASWFAELKERKSGLESNRWMISPDKLLNYEWQSIPAAKGALIGAGIIVDRCLVSLVNNRRHDTVLSAKQSQGQRCAWLDMVWAGLANQVCPLSDKLVTITMPSLAQLPTDPNVEALVLTYVLLIAQTTRMRVATHRTDCDQWDALRSEDSEESSGRLQAAPNIARCSADTQTIADDHYSINNSLELFISSN